MKTCDEIRDRSWSYLDGELDPAVEAVVDSHLTRCPECEELFAARRSLLETVARARAEKAPPGLRARVESILAADAASRRSSPRRWRAGWKVALPLAAVVATLLLFRAGTDPSSGPAHAAHGFAADHSAHAVADPSGRPFRADEERPPPAPRLAAGRVVGVSRCVVDERVYAHYVYAVDGATVSAFLPVRGELAGEARGGGTIDGSEVVAVSRGGRGFVLVSTDLPRERLLGLPPGA